MDVMTTLWENMQNTANMDETIDLDSNTVDQIDKCLANSESHMGDFVAQFRGIRDILHSYERHQQPSSDGRNTHIIQQGELEDLFLIFCGTIDSLKKRETHLEGKMEDLQKRLDELQRVKDDWLVVAEDDIATKSKIDEAKKMTWRPRVPWI